MMAKLVLLWAAILAYLSGQCFALPEDEVNSRSKILRKVAGTTKDERLYLEKCRQSSQFENCVFATDGEINQEPWSNECSSTKQDAKPWFEARLENPAYVTKVDIHTVKDVGKRGLDALTDFQLIAGGHICVRYRSSVSFENRTFSCDVFADYIRIESFVQMGMIILCEIVPHGKYVNFDYKSDGHTQLSPISCIMSSVSSPEDSCMKVIDNHLGQNAASHDCSVTGAEEAAWVELRLKEPALVKTIKVVNRDDCCKEGLNNFEITVDGQLCAIYDQDQTFSVKDFTCTRFGRLVRLTNRKSGALQLAVCEITVYGFPVMYETQDNYKYVGCYRERKNRRDLKKLAAINRMSLEKCERMCRREKGMDYFGLQQGRQCWCSDRYGMYGELDEESCWMPCDANPHQACGAKLVNSVFELAERTPDRISLPLVALNGSFVNSTLTTFGSGGVNITTSGKTTSSSKSSVTKTTSSTTP